MAFPLPGDSSTRLGSLPKDADSASSDPFLLCDTEVPFPPPEEFIPPDGGFGWVVAIAACLANVWIVGFTKSYSILYLEIMEKFPDNTAYETSWIPVMSSTLGLLVSPLIGAMCNRYGERTIGSVGGLLCFLGIFLSAFASTLTQMVLTMGVLTGLGRGLVQTSAVLIANMYFNKRRAFGSAICVSGNAFGGFLMPPLMEYLLKEYRLQGTLLIAAGLQLQILLSTFLFRPTRDHAIIQARHRRKEVRKEKLLRSEATIPKKIGPGKISILNVSELNFPQKTILKAPFEKVQTSFILSKLDAEKDAITQELSIYRNMPLPGSAPNLTPFLETSAQSASENVANCKSIFVRPHNRDIGEIQNNISSYSLHDAEVISKKNVRKRSQSESTAYEQISAVTALPNFKPFTPNTQQHIHKRVQMSLHHFVGGNNATKLCTNVENSNGSAVLNNYDGIDYPFTMSPNKEDTPEEYRCDGSRPLKNENMNGLDPKICNKDSPPQDLVPCCKGYQSYKKERQHITPKRSSNCNSCLTIMKSCFDKEVLKTVSMILTCISSSLFFLGSPHALYFLHAYFTSVDVDSKVVTKLLSLTSIVDLSGRLIVGYVADMNVIRLTVLYFLCTGLAGTCAFCVPFVRSVASIAVVLCGYGFGVGGFVVLLPTMLARNHGIDKLSSSYSFVRMLHGVINFISPQVCGLLADLTGNYASVYYFMGTAMTVSSVLQRSRYPKNRAVENEAEQANA